MKDLSNRAIKAAEKFLERRGYEVIDRNWQNGASEIDLVARDEDGTVVIVDVAAREGAGKGFPHASEGARERMEAAAAQWLASQDDESLVDVRVRFDSVSMVVISEDRAFLRHHINMFGAAETVA